MPTMRDRVLALVQGRALDGVPFVVYEGMFPIDEVYTHLGRGKVGHLRWSAIHRTEHSHCHFQHETYHVGETRWQRDTGHMPMPLPQRLDVAGGHDGLGMTAFPVTRSQSRSSGSDETATMFPSL